MAQEKSGGNFTRRRIATLILLKMIDTPGPPRGKVDAAVNYADELLDRLKRRRKNGQTATHASEDDSTTIGGR